ncbi:DBH-like monooxygenase protein 1 [Eurytemora carolleeae]|uniref:DBH-like monooxygenase protein 1 n=1 Tax=Eurytemora carolleeae TaxID=1294199 RepID=UPI000C7593AE|nr:DBH-like monooxygenase protein 1 [Eurytemora carolleeae]|eukprot:XP_023339731.1 DBH-like monooxygenase protein 1 [Eurytemora affinis]
MLWTYQILNTFKTDKRRFRRKLETCDLDDDIRITNDTFRVIWAYGGRDPGEEEEVSWRDVDRAGGRLLHLYQGEVQEAREPSMKKWVVTSNKYSIETLYWCTMVKLPSLAQRHHMVGYRPRIQPGNERFVHHMMLYECHDSSPDQVFSKHVDSMLGYECYTPNMPDDFLKCRGIVAAWGLGGEPFYFPEEAGYPLGEEHGGATYYMFEVHYENPGLHSNIADNSGLEIHLTPHLRTQDSSMITIGHDVSTLHLVPPNQPSFTTVAHCPAQCTSALPENGIRVFAGLPHTHLLGIKVKLRHIRNGAELPIPFQDNYYDFNYQTMRRIEFNLLPGDHLITECVYDSRGRDGYTRGGMRADDEMCMMFLHYYPAVNIAQCVSKLPLKNLLLAMGVSLWPVTPDTRHLGLRIRSPDRYQNLTLSDYMSAVLPGDLDAAKRLQEANLHHSQVAECFDFGKRNVIADGLEFSSPKIHTPFYHIDETCNPYAKDDKLFLETFQKHLNQPLDGSTVRSRALAAAPTVALLFIVSLLAFSPNMCD